ncbi:MAG: hypothetical protein ACXWID_11455 [Pyrinomonadaceae bacterium]
MDKDIDGQVIRILANSENGAACISKNPTRLEILEEVISKQHSDFGQLVDDMPQPTMYRRVLKVLFPLVEENQRVRT